VVQDSAWALEAVVEGSKITLEVDTLEVVEAMEAVEAGDDEVSGLCLIESRN